MSRSRRKRKLPKCICGRREIAPLDHITPRHWTGCYVLQYVDIRNERFLKYLERRRQIRSPLSEED